MKDGLPAIQVDIFAGEIKDANTVEDDLPVIQDDIFAGEIKDTNTVEDDLPVIQDDIFPGKLKIQTQSWTAGMMNFSCHVVYSWLPWERGL
ncbi:hypothetical protein [Chitinophaga sp.]|uniref:hypothetical protein n=1 Tax=Chitinophaga sp. TaxID=1869181 RepID=UPI0031E2C75B